VDSVEQMTVGNSTAGRANLKSQTLRSFSRNQALTRLIHISLHAPL
jgi:hypothetical protein